MIQDSLKTVVKKIQRVDTLTVQISNDINLSDDTKDVIQSISESQVDVLPVYIIPLLSVLIAVIALILSKKALDNSKRHNVISLKPLLIFREATMQKSSKIRIYIANKGIGPLTFTEFEMVYENKSYTKMYHLFEEITKKFQYERKDFDVMYRTFTNPLIDYSLKIDEEKSLVKYDLKGKTDKEARALYAEFKKISFNYTYNDLYDNVISDSYQIAN